MNQSDNGQSFAGKYFAIAKRLHDKYPDLHRGIATDSDDLENHPVVLKRSNLRDRKYNHLLDKVNDFLDGQMETEALSDIDNAVSNMDLTKINWYGIDKNQIDQTTLVTERIQNVKLEINRIKEYIGLFESHLKQHSNRNQKEKRMFIMNLNTDWKKLKLCLRKLLLSSFDGDPEKNFNQMLILTTDTINETDIIDKNFIKQLKLLNLVDRDCDQTTVRESLFKNFR